MWDTVSQVGTGLTLVTFLAAAIVTILRQRLKARERQLVAAPEEDRAAVIQSLNDSFLVPSLPVDPSRLTPQQSYKLLLEQIRERSRRFYVTAVVVVLLAMLIAGVTVFAIQRARALDTAKETGNGTATVSTSEPGDLPETETSVTETITTATSATNLVSDTQGNGTHDTAGESTGSLDSSGTTATGTTGTVIVGTTTEPPLVVEAKPAEQPAVKNVRVLFTNIRSTKDAATRLDVELLTATNDPIGTAAVINVPFESRRTTPVDLVIAPTATAANLEKRPYKLRVKITTGKDEWVFSAKAVLEWLDRDPSTHNFKQVRVNQLNPIVTLPAED